MRKELESLLPELELAYSRSDIAALCREKSWNWGFSLITTNLTVKRTLILGFNWGAAEVDSYTSQHSIEAESFLDQDLGSFSRIIPYCDKYMGNGALMDASQSNYCFFRSKTESQISSKGIQLCEPVFNKMLGLLQPSAILCFSSRLRDYLAGRDIVSNLLEQEIKFKRGATQIVYEAKKGILNGDCRIYFLPHPNYPMKKAAREQAWAFCFGGQQQDSEIEPN